MDASEFYGNTGSYGGALTLFDHNINTIEASEFYSNSATKSRGVMYSNWNTITIIEASEFHDNSYWQLWRCTVHSQ